VNISGTTVLLTGATGGIGHAIARRLHREGASLILTGRRADVLEPLAQEVGGRAVAVDLSDRAAVDRFIAEIGDVDIVVANAALPASGRLDSFSIEELDRALEVNLRAPLVMTHHYAEAFAARGSGHLVFISSLAGKAGSAYASLYNATKFGLRGFGQGLRPEMAEQGVGVSVIFPGFISDAGMFADSGVTPPRGVGTSTPEEVADAVVTAIVKDKAEIDVAPLSMKLGTRFAGVAPTVSAKVQKLTGGDKLSAKIGAGQTDKR
jgi:short-subunit dehydrogenase